MAFASNAGNALKFAGKNVPCFTDFSQLPAMLDPVTAPAPKKRAAGFTP
jgi:hypothetical protein